MVIYRSELLLVLVRGPSCELGTQTRLNIITTRSAPSLKIMIRTKAELRSTTWKNSGRQFSAA